MPGKRTPTLALTLRLRPGKDSNSKALCRAGNYFLDFGENSAAFRWPRLSFIQLNRCVDHGDNSCHENETVGSYYALPFIA